MQVNLSYFLVLISYQIVKTNLMVLIVIVVTAYAAKALNSSLLSVMQYKLTQQKITIYV